MDQSRIITRQNYGSNNTPRRQQGEKLSKLNMSGTGITENNT